MFARDESGHRRQVGALALFLLIPLVTMLGGTLANLINPEIAAGHPNYGLNWHLLSTLKTLCLLGSFALAGMLWLLVCLLVIQAKKLSYLWLMLAGLGPIGFAMLATLKDRDALETDRYARFVRNLNWLVRAGYEVGSFVIAWELAYQAMVVMRTLIIWYQAFRTGMSTAQIVDLQNASSGMWAFGEGIEVMYFAVLLYLLRPLVFNVVAKGAAAMALHKAG